MDCISEESCRMYQPKHCSNDKSSKKNEFNYPNNSWNFNNASQNYRQYNKKLCFYGYYSYKEILKINQD